VKMHCLLNIPRWICLLLTLLQASICEPMHQSMREWTYTYTYTYTRRIPFIYRQPVAMSTTIFDEMCTCKHHFFVYANVSKDLICFESFVYLFQA
jgi:hypothetical protein